MAEKAQLTAKVHGYVQGVCFRQFVKFLATGLELQGYVRNLPDGSTVEVQAVGEKDNLEIMVTNLRKGPPGAEVKEVEITWSDEVGHFDDFIVLY